MFSFNWLACTKYVFLIPPIPSSNLAFFSYKKIYPTYIYLLPNCKFFLFIKFIKNILRYFFAFFAPL